ncbi:translation machinery-associated protein 16 [Conoideocrella luteorostrata]|uniref:Translation machinery-associated protein 16 n=1 Tax=Conoideocrella luteorostrata TaxID=1105319 RepID=A0AAJ0CWC1_9HYPO|nr:translation machinery-associated protein 16 [Conoideocrella luteorostrata]
MPSSLQKTRKHIAKKRNGEVNALHVKSRDSLRLHKAGVRDQRLEKLAAARGKREQPIVDRVAFFQECLAEMNNEPFDVESVKSQIQKFIHQYDEEYDSIKKARRPGRPASAREDLLKIKIAALEEEYQNGFVLPDFTSAESAKLLENWKGEWAYLMSLSWVKVSVAGQPRPSEFPSKGIS